MGKDSVEAEKRKGAGPQEQIAALWPQVFSHLAHFTNAAESTVRCGVSITHRDDSTWLAVARGVGADDQPVVCFGSGDTWLGAIARLNSAMGAGAWKPDKYAK